MFLTGRVTGLRPLNQELIKAHLPFHKEEVPLIPNDDPEALVEWINRIGCEQGLWPDESVSYVKSWPESGGGTFVCRVAAGVSQAMHTYLLESPAAHRMYTRFFYITYPDEVMTGWLELALKQMYKKNGECLRGSN